MASSLTQGPQLKRSQGAKTTTYQAGSRLSFTSTATAPSRLQVPVYAANPATCTVGEICVSGGKLYVCSATNTWTVAGSQT
jgi:hypothetical protein